MPLYARIPRAGQLLLPLPAPLSRPLRLAIQSTPVAARLSRRLGIPPARAALIADLAGFTVAGDANA